MTGPVVTPIELPFRAVPEWVGRTPDSIPPRAVRARVLLRYQNRCYLTGQPIRVGDDWDLEHVKPLRSATPGEPHLNRESNLAPAHKAAHREKTSREKTDGSKADRIHAKHFGYYPKSPHRLQSRGFSKRAYP